MIEIDVGEVLVHVRNKAIDGEVGVRAFRSVRDQLPTPEIGRQLFERRIRETPRFLLVENFPPE